MKGINKTIIVGHLGQDPEIKYTPAGAAVTSISVATSESWKDKTTGANVEKTEWHKITFFGRLAEIAGEYLKKGNQVYIEGKLQTNKWTDKNGQDRYTTNIVAHELQMLGSRNDQQSQQQSNQQPSRQAVQPQQAQHKDDLFDDDIPF